MNRRALARTPVIFVGTQGFHLHYAPVFPSGEQQVRQSEIHFRRAGGSPLAHRRL